MNINADSRTDARKCRTVLPKVGRAAILDRQRSRFRSLTRTHVKSEPRLALAGIEGCPRPSPSRVFCLSDRQILDTRARPFFGSRKFDSFQVPFRDVAAPAGPFRKRVASPFFPGDATCPASRTSSRKCTCCTSPRAASASRPSRGHRDLRSRKCRSWLLAEVPR